LVVCQTDGVCVVGAGTASNANYQTRCEEHDDDDLLAAWQLEFENGGDGKEDYNEVGEGVDNARGEKVERLRDAVGLGVKCHGPVV
jgi:hypothetical protein